MLKDKLAVPYFLADLKSVKAYKKALNKVARVNFINPNNYLHHKY